ncbi:Smr/MutS family protein [Legionella waltersii]|uniref:DNA mismatch repair protein-like protein n=1 Tax=Legionella waltersii TaxID=66969 RepID=A0A0W1AGM9_9GAMM|nr:Smr/MutS family protein [Legionella waltersii]KTD80527.1 DNA mismatch repair protein-like protein [Legionella waltersii]SNV09439.1 Smr domain protein, DNA mismatch repair protein-like protein [Legionella waltersii]
MTDKPISDEDKELFREHMQAVKPLKNAKKRIDIKTPPPETKSPKNKPKQLTPAPKELFLSDYISDPVLSESILSYSDPSIPNRRFRDLKNGLIPWEARLDLHGLTSEEARRSLLRFIEKQKHNHKRCLLIIHGKGGHQGARPVIKNLVNRWLPQFEEVLAFHSALPKDGGTGAVYVLLKKGAHSL